MFHISPTDFIRVHINIIVTVEPFLVAHEGIWHLSIKVRGLEREAWLLVAVEEHLRYIVFHDVDDSRRQKNEG